MSVVFAFLDSILAPQELLIVGVIAILLYGERLPEMAKKAGKGLMQFKKGLNDIRSEIESVATGATTSTPRRSHCDDIEDREEATAPKFEPPPGEPLAEAEKPVA
jgi:sec-independent protein translocase protein TatA